MKVTELRKGALFVEREDPWKVEKYEHIKMGRGGATIKVKARNLITDTVREFSYNSGAKVEDADVETVKTKLLYQDGKQAHFDNKVDLPISEIREKVEFLKSGTEITMIFFEGEPIDILIPITVDLKVKRSDPAVAGNTSGNATKEALLESGIRIHVPLFVNEGDTVRVNTESRSYVTRV